MASVRIEKREYKGTNWIGSRRRYLVRWVDVSGICVRCSRSLEIKRYLADVALNVPFVLFFLLLLATDSRREGVRGELMHGALIRARVCELLAAASGVPRAAGSLFLVGMISLLDHALETPMNVLVDSMELAPDIRAALLHREDFYGAVLALVEAYENGWWDEVDALAPAVGIDLPVLANAYVEAVAWAQAQRAGDPGRKVASRASATGVRAVV